MVDPAAVDLSTLRYLNNGGEPPRSSTIKPFEERFGVPGRVLPGYGLAEAVLGVTVTKLGDTLLVDDHGNVSNGRPFPGIEVRIDGDGSEPGEILVRRRGVRRLLRLDRGVPARAARRVAAHR
jgi:acyl-CoA synthetase (AMP-forming)/AMP-acid ligase II